MEIVTMVWVGFGVIGVYVLYKVVKAVMKKRNISGTSSGRNRDKNTRLK